MQILAVVERLHHLWDKIPQEFYNIGGDAANDPFFPPMGVITP